MVFSITIRMGVVFSIALMWFTKDLRVQSAFLLSGASIGIPLGLKYGKKS